MQLQRLKICNTNGVKIHVESFSTDHLIRTIQPISHLFLFISFLFNAFIKLLSFLLSASTGCVILLADGESVLQLSAHRPLWPELPFHKIVTISVTFAVAFLWLISRCLLGKTTHDEYEGHLSLDSKKLEQIWLPPVLGGLSPPLPLFMMFLSPVVSLLPDTGFALINAHVIGIRIINVIIIFHIWYLPITPLHLTLAQESQRWRKVKSSCQTSHLRRNLKVSNSE